MLSRCLVKDDLVVHRDDALTMAVAGRLGVFRFSGVGVQLERVRLLEGLHSDL